MVPLEGLQEFEIIGKDNKAFASLFQCPDEVKILLAMAGRENAGKIGVSCPVFYQ